MLEQNYQQEEKMFTKQNISSSGTRAFNGIKGGLIISAMFLLIIFNTVTKAQSVAPQTVFTNSSPITINDASTATPYPSTITASGLGTSIPATAGSVKVTLNGFSHTFPDDVGIVLVGPTGAAIC